jgi:anti-sigma factor RsiW
MDSQYEKEMENHIAGCADCARQMAAYKSISLSLAPAGDELTGEARQRVLKKLETAGAYSSYGNRMAWGPPIWKRRVSIPIPAAAAVVFMLIALAFLWITRSNGRIEPANMAITAETEIIPGIIPVSGMESVLQYLDGNDTGEIIILRLPESRNFASYGEPAIIKAADYQPNMPVRRKR